MLAWWLVRYITEDQLSISGKLLRRSRLLIAGFPPGCTEWKQTPDIAQSSKKANLSGMQCFSLPRNWNEENQHRKKIEVQAVPFRDFIQNMSQAPSKCLSNWIKVNELEYFKKPSHEFKKSFCYWAPLYDFWSRSNHVIWRFWSQIESY